MVPNFTVRKEDGEETGGWYTLNVWVWGCLFHRVEWEMILSTGHEQDGWGQRKRMQEAYSIPWIGGLFRESCGALASCEYPQRSPSRLVSGWQGGFWWSWSQAFGKHSMSVVNWSLIIPILWPNPICQFTGADSCCFVFFFWLHFGYLEYKYLWGGYRQPRVQKTYWFCGLLSKLSLGSITQLVINLLYVC